MILELLQVTRFITLSMKEYTCSLAQCIINFYYDTVLNNDCRNRHFSYYKWLLNNTIFVILLNRQTHLLLVI